MNKTLLSVILGGVVAFVVSAALAFVGSLSHADLGQTPILIGGVLGIFTALIRSLLQGTRKTTKADGGSRERALSFRPPAGKSFVYLVRTGFAGKAVGLNISLNGIEVAQIKSPQFTCLEVGPGEHIIGARFGGGAGSQNTPTSHAITCKAGEVTVLHCSRKVGMLKNQLLIEPWTLETARIKLVDMTMVMPDAMGLSGA